MLKWLVSLIFIFIFSFQSYAGDFEKVDKYARSVRKSGNYKELAIKLTYRFVNEEDKARAIYVWITDNIKYDWNKFQNNLKGRGRYHIKGRTKAEILLKKKKINEKRINTVFRTGKGICEDYSMLFKAMCDEIGLKSIIINGKIKVNPNNIGNFPNRSSHAWNAVKINNKWRLVDATWGSGYVRSGVFYKKFEDRFFMTEPEIFILNHFPDDPKWQLLEKQVSKQEFSNFVFVHSAFYENKVIDFSPKTGFLNAKNKFAIVKMKFKNTPPDVYIYSDNKLKKTGFIKHGNEIEIKVPTLGKHNKQVKIVIRKGNKVLPLLEYKIEENDR